MKVCVVLPAHWDAIMGGGQYQAKLLVEKLVKDGHEVFYLARTISKNTRPKEYQLCSIKGPLKSRVGDSLALYRRLQAIMPDVIYQRVGCAYTAVCALYAKRNNTKMIWHLASDMDVGHATPFSRNPFNMIESSMISYGRRAATQIVAQTESQARALHSVSKRSASVVIPNFQPFPTESSTKNDDMISILWIGNLKPVKQPEIFVQLAKSLRYKSELHFSMIGRPYPDARKQNHFDMDIKGVSNLTYLGGKAIDEVNMLLAGADLLVNTSSVEGFSNTFIQAWMRRVPVLSLSVNPDGILSNPAIGRCADGSLDRLVADVLELAENSLLRSDLASNVDAHAKRVHSMANVSTLSKHITG